MIETATGAALARIAARQAEVAHAFESGFEPERSDATLRRSAGTISLDPLDVVAPEGAYFVAAGDGGTLRFTRDGCFALRDGELRGKDGRAILGYPLVGARRLRPLRVDPADAALQRLANARVEADGTVAYDRATVEPRTGQRRTARVVLGRLALARFPAGSQPLRLDATHVAPPAGVTAQTGSPADETFGALLTHRRDTGRLDATAGLERLQEAYLAFDALRAANAARGGVDKTLMDLVK